MNPFFLSAKEQVALWKSLREEVTQLPDKEALQKVADFWAAAPLLKMAYDPEDCSEWPSPWEMLDTGDYCPYSIAIMMEATLRLAGWEPSRMKLKTIRDYDLSEQRMILIIDSEVVLNYSVGMIQEYPTTRHDVLAAFQNDGKRYSSVPK